MQNYQQPAFEIRESRARFRVEIVSMVIECLGSGMKNGRKNK